MTASHSANLLNPRPGLAEAIRLRARQFADASYTEIDAKAQHVASVSDLFDRALIIQNELAQLGGPGQPDVLVCVESAFDIVSAAWACILAGRNMLPLHFHSSGLRNRDMAARLRMFAGKLNDPVMLTTSAIRPHIPADALGSFTQTLCIDQIGSAFHPHETSPRNSRQMSAPAGSHILLPTSGVTGVSKIVAVTHDAFLARMLFLHGAQGPSSAVVSVFPFDSIGGLSSLLWPRTTRNCYLQPERLATAPLELLKIVEQFKIERLSLTSSLAARLVHGLDKDVGRSFDLSSLKVLSLGAELIVPSIVTSLSERLERCGAQGLGVVTGYGMTETGLMCVSAATPWQDAFSDPRSPVSVGSRATDYRLRIVDDKGAALPDSTAGKLEVRSETRLFRGYYNDPQETALAFSSDGWFKTGDVGFLEKDALTLIGREKSIIIVNGRNISLEQIEYPLRTMPGIHQALLAAIPVRQDGSMTDELAVFFVPETHPAGELDGLCRAMLRHTANNFGITISHLVPLTASQFPRTTMDKTRRWDLAEAFHRGEYVPHRLEEKPTRGTKSAPHLSATERRLAEIWQQVLGRERPPSPNANFYDLGGDSFASAALIARVEDEFRCELPIEDFFKDPTIANMAALLASGARYFNGSCRDSHGSLLQSLRSYAGSWRGERLTREGLIAGANVSGTKDPVFWVFQDESEFERLGTRLGPDQPLYGLRSLVGIVPIKDYPKVLDLVAESYLKEILTLQAPRLIVGGNCQGGIIALALARKLKYAGRMPAPLVLMEWLYNYGRYTGPTVLLYGKKSHSAKRFESEQPDDLKWQADFPQRSIRTVPGRHGEFFTDLNLDHLATALGPYLT